MSEETLDKTWALAQMINGGVVRHFTFDDKSYLKYNNEKDEVFDETGKSYCINDLKDSSFNYGWSLFEPTQDQDQVLEKRRLATLTDILNNLDAATLDTVLDAVRKKDFFVADVIHNESEIYFMNQNKVTTAIIKGFQIGKTKDSVTTTSLKCFKHGLFYVVQYRNGMHGILAEDDIFTSVDAILKNITSGVRGNPDEV